MKRKNEQGFTLVEVIVVAVIVAVLAAVAIPLYNGYIRDSRVNVCQNNAASIASSITAALQQDPTFSTAASGANFLSVPSLSDNTIFSNINLPEGYTYSVASNAVTVNGPGNTNSTAVPFSQ
jgi:prepilin-type N-terminal cleavage/methylation domain-containing protein